MKTKLLSYLLVVVCLCSCAHKSGHGNMQGVPPNTTGSHRPSSHQRPTAPTTQQPAPATHVPPETVNDVPTIPSGGNDHSGRTKMEGQDIYQKYNSAVFMVYTSDGYMGYQGSGFFINQNGLAVSNYHVFKGTTIGKEQIILAGSNKVYKISEVIKKNEEKDFILFKVNLSGTNCIPIAKSKPRVGERVFAIGSPRGFENTFSSGEVSQWRDEYTIQTSVPLDHGSSGGALINEYGEIVGITSGTLYVGSTAAVNYAISIDVVKPYINLR